MDKSNKPEWANRQRGAVLAISLILLAILTVLGVTAMNTSMLQNTMANNFQYQIGAMQNAEISVQLGEDITANIVDTGNALGFEVFDAADNEYHLAGTVDPGDQDWVSAGYSPKETTDGEYVIEYAGVVPMGVGNAVGVGNGGSTAGNTGHVFLISARSESSKGAKRTVQTSLVALVP